MLIYVDTNIYLDLIENRTDRLRPLGEFAFELLRGALNCEFEIVVSSVLFFEIEFNNKKKEFRYWFDKLKFKNKIQDIFETDLDIQFARKLSKQRKIGFNDCLHAVIAQKSGAEFIVTRNMKDFIPLQDLIKPKFPETL